MREIVAEILVAIALTAVGMLVVYMAKGEQARSFDLDTAYIIGALAIAIPTIAILEWRRRRKY
ncbi:MAG: hypothetical protein H0T42_23050 [Deltaproteobacteria bacterium]|nr:hypothetical protein [Deltaproteobacteria bacterium]